LSQEKIKIIHRRHHHKEIFVSWGCSSVVKHVRPWGLILSTMREREKEREREREREVCNAYNQVSQIAKNPYRSVR
jgi:hypothetical protein